MSAVRAPPLSTPPVKLNFIPTHSWLGLGADQAIEITCEPGCKSGETFFY